jgi:hypothetical protein
VLRRAREGHLPHAPSLRRVLRLLASVAVFAEEVDGKFALTPIGACLRTGVPGSMHAVALLFGGITDKAWSDLLYSVETGKPAFNRVFGMDSFSYMAQHLEEAANFDKAMSSGGGNGSLLAGILRANPGLRGIVFERPHVAERAKEHVKDEGLADRCEVVGGDFFREVPGGGDAYLLKHVIHDWDDEHATAILKNCGRAMGPSGRLLIVEGIYPLRIDPSGECRGAASNDVNMLVCTGGRQRSEDEFRSLLHAAGLKLTRIVPTPARVGVIEGVRA